MYAEVFGIDVPLTQSHPTESTQGTHRTPSVPRSPNPNMDAGVLSAPKRSTVIRFCIPQRRSTRLTPPARDKESPEVEITNDEEVEITNVVIPVNVNEEEEEITDEVYELKRREKGKIVEESRSTPFPTPIRSPRIHTDLAEISSQIQQAIDINIPSRVDAFVRSYMSGHILHVHPAQPQTSSVPKQLYLLMKAIPQTSAIHLRDQDDPHDDAHFEGESMKKNIFKESRAYMTKESSGQVNEKEQGQSSSRNQEQTDDYD
ncbi:hypothetical protein Tco_1536634, partial [Tanacetum coccineum]